MFLRVKKQIIGLIDTVDEMVHIFDKIERQTAVNDCKMAMHSILGALNKEEPLPQQSIDKIKLILCAFDEITVTNIADDVSGKIKYLQKNIKAFRQSIQNEIVPKLNVAFFPYKATMWNSLATVYEAAAQDENCVAKVIPVPFYEIGGPQPISCYEGDKFPDNVPITPYDQYDLEVEQPDIIFVHNIYDQYNTITQVEPTYFASNLKKYTDMLVYIPYDIPTYKRYKKGQIGPSLSSPASQFVDKIIVPNELIKEGAVNYGIPEKKLLVLGSPKIDNLARIKILEKNNYPNGWKAKLERKKVYLLNTGCLFFAENPAFAISCVTEIYTAILMTSMNNALIWRPHPLTMISLKKYTPDVLPWYNSIIEYIQNRFRGYNKSILIDTTADYNATLEICDVLISPPSSLVNEYLVTGKKIIVIDDGSMGTQFKHDPFYHLYDSERGLMNLLIDFDNGYDDKKELRKEAAKLALTTIDGSCGATIYKLIKTNIMKSDIK